MLTHLARGRMLFSDFLKYFNEVGVCDPFKAAAASGDDFIHCETVCDHWQAGISAGGRSAHPTFKYNPRFALTAESEEVFVTFYQPDRRFANGYTETSVPWLDQYIYLVDPDKPDEPEKKMYLSRRQETATLKVEPGKTYELVAAAWGVGVEGVFWITASGVECKLKRIPPPANPTRAESRQMARQKSRHNLCVFTGEPIAGVFYDTEEGQVAEDAYPAYRESKADKCYICSGPVLEKYYTHNEGKVHAEDDGKDCQEKYKLMTADKCHACNEAILETFFTVDEGKIHGEGDCMAEHKKATADKCLTCNGPILDRFYTVDDGKIHAEGDCMDKHRAATADKCFICTSPLLGQFYTVDDGKVCAEGDCHQKYKELKVPARRRPPPAALPLHSVLPHSLVRPAQQDDRTSCLRSHRPTSAWSVGRPSLGRTTRLTAAESARRATATRSTVEQSGSVRARVLLCCLEWDFVLVFFKMGEKL